MDVHVLLLTAGGNMTESADFRCDLRAGHTELLFVVG